MFIPGKEEKTVKIPIRVVNGQIKYFYGGNLPEIKEGAIGDLIVPEYSVSNSVALDVFMEENIIEVLPKDTIIMASVSLNLIPKERQKKTKSINTNMEYHNGKRFVEIKLHQPLQLRERGSKKANLLPSECIVPSIDEKQVLRSLNQAYTKISEYYEPSRISHTGNVFEKCFYESGDKWYPLEDLRAKSESQIEERMFFDNKIFCQNEKIDLAVYSSLDENETKLMRALVAKKELSGHEIKALFEYNKDIYIRLINALIDKKMIQEKR